MSPLLPPTAGADARRLVASRALRGLADGLVSVVLADYLTRLGLGGREAGAIVAGTLLGSAALTIALGLSSHRVPRRPLLLAACVLMLATGIGFASLSGFAALLLIAVVGTMNPSAGDVSVFLPAEQAVLSQSASAPDRTLLFAWWNLAGALAGALGASAAGLPQWIAARAGGDVLAADRGVFVFYAAIAVAVLPLYAGLSPRVEAPPAARASPLARSRGVVLRLAALFALDSFGGGFVVQSMLVLWLFRRFALSTALAGAIFFASGVFAAFSQLVSARIASRIGHVRTMVYTHLPANLFLLLAGLMPTPGLAVAFLLARAALSSMDVPARQAYVMAMVPPEERAAAASVTNVPRSLASALPPLATGWMLDHTSFGWPLIVAGALKATYDLLLLAQFAHRKPREDA